MNLPSLGIRPGVTPRRGSLEPVESWKLFEQPICGGELQGRDPKGRGVVSWQQRAGGAYQSSAGSYCFQRGRFPPLLSPVLPRQRRMVLPWDSHFTAFPRPFSVTQTQAAHFFCARCCRDYLGAPAAVPGGTTLPPRRAELVWASQVRSPWSNPPQAHAHAAEQLRFQARVTSSLLTCQPAWSLPRPWPLPHCRWTWLTPNPGIRFRATLSPQAAPQRSPCHPLTHGRTLPSPCWGKHTSRPPANEVKSTPPLAKPYLEPATSSHHWPTPRPQSPAEGDPGSTCKLHSGFS